MKIAIVCLAALFLAMGIAIASPDTGSTEILPTYAILPASILRPEGVAIPIQNLSRFQNWHGLVCAINGCEFRPASLNFDKQPDSNDQPGCGKIHIHYLPLKKIEGEFTIAFIVGNSEVSSTQLPSWFTSHTPRTAKDAENGSLGITISTPTQGDVHLVPRWNKRNNDTYLTLYLENKKQRQSLGRISLEAVNAGFKTSDILIWAGDMDGDGKIDLITRVGSETPTGLRLWLSSKRDENEMVGVAATLENWIDIEEQEGC
ncbi:MAG: hypothetical protein HOO97_11690 [Sideroxydans sp.]|nr:hypothetical protein [Sideroxydans sp.]